MPYCRKVSSRKYVCYVQELLQDQYCVAQLHCSKVRIYNMRILMFENCLFWRYVFTPPAGYMGYVQELGKISNALQKLEFTTCEF